MSRPKYKQGIQIHSISEFDSCESLWYKWNGRTRHRSVLISLQYRTLLNTINDGRLYVADPIGDKHISGKENKKMAVKEKPLLEDVIDWGQGYDDTIMELLESFQKFRDGYYGLVNYGDDWWKNFNQGRDFDEIMKEQWEEFETVNFMNLVEKMAVAIAGTYVRFDDFAEGVKKCYEQGKGLRHKESVKIVRSSMIKTNVKSQTS